MSSPYSHFCIFECGIEKGNSQPLLFKWNAKIAKIYTYWKQYYNSIYMQKSFHVLISSFHFFYFHIILCSKNVKTNSIFNIYDVFWLNWIELKPNFRTGPYPECIVILGKERNMRIQIKNEKKVKLFTRKWTKKNKAIICCFRIICLSTITTTKNIWPKGERRLIKVFRKFIEKMKKGKIDGENVMKENKYM